MGDDEAERLAKLIDSVADGAAVDWDAIDEVSTQAAFAPLLRALRVVAGLADVHRSAVYTDSSRQGSEPGPKRSDEGGGIGRWGNFHLIRKIGEGSFGEVYHARDTWLDHGVALKLVKPGLVDRSRFLHEARTLAQVRHPNVVTIHGADVHDGRLGFWMELIEGQTLAGVVAREGVRGAGEATVIGQDLCRAIAAVHATKIVHRDIKAQNVMRQSGTGRLVLMDFGAGEALQVPSATVDGRRFGTPLYLAPELFTGGRATKQSDIYALGVLLFYLVTGHFPVQGDSVDDLAQAHARGERSRLGDARPDLPDSFVRVVETMIAPDPAHRYETAAGAREALEAAVSPAARYDFEINREASPRRSLPGLALKWGVASAIAFGTITLLGLLSTAAFNQTFGRWGFDAESPFQWFVWGLRSLVAPAAVTIVATLTLMLVVGVAKVVCRLIPSVGTGAARIGGACREFLRSRQLDDPHLQLQLVAGAGFLMFVVLAASFWPHATAAWTYINDADVETLAPLRPLEVTRFVYVRLLDLALFVYGFVAYVVYAYARRARVLVPSTTIASVIAVPAVALLLMRELPYRIMYQNAFDRVDLDDARCYAIGRRADEILLHCPDMAPPRNRVVGAHDPRLRPRGIIESVFTPREQPRQ